MLLPMENRRSIPARAVGGQLQWELQVQPLAHRPVCHHLLWLAVSIAAIISSFFLATVVQCFQRCAPNKDTGDEDEDEDD